MAAMPYMQLYVADYLADTMHLNAEEHGAYLMLLMNYWQRGKPLPDDDRKLAMISRTDADSWLNIRSTLVDFFKIVDGEWHHCRVETELEKVRSKSVAAKKAGQASAIAKKKEKEAKERARQAPENKGKSPALNERSTDVEQTLNHTDTDTDTEPPPPSGVGPQGAVALVEKPKRKPAKRSAQLSDDWKPQPQATAPLALIGWESARIGFEVDKFRDHAKATGRTAKDWDAAFRNWVRKAMEFSQARGTSTPGGPPAKWVEHEQNRREITKRLIEESENASNDQGNLISDGRKFDGPEDYAQRAEPDRGAERFGEIVELPALNQSRI